MIVLYFRSNSDSADFERSQQLEVLRSPALGGAESVGGRAYKSYGCWIAIFEKWLFQIGLDSASILRRSFPTLQAHLARNRQ